MNKLEREKFRIQKLINVIDDKIIQHRINNIYNKLVSKEKITRGEIRCKSI